MKELSIKEKARAYDKFLKEAVEGRIVDDGGEIHLVVPELPAITRNMDDGDYADKRVKELNKRIDSHHKNQPISYSLETI